MEGERGRLVGLQVGLGFGQQPSLLTDSQADKPAPNPRSDELLSKATNAASPFQDSLYDIFWFWFLHVDKKFYIKYYPFGCKRIATLGYFQ